MKKRRIIIICVSLIIVFICVILILLDIPHWKSLDISKITDLSLASRVFDANGEAIENVYSYENRVFASLEELPTYVPQAFIAVEDARFYEHGGIDVKRIFGALLHDIKTFSLSQGASTITQQLIKLTHLSGEKTFARKAQEAYLAMQLEKRMSKDEILEAYINIVYFGNGAYGINAAAERYFGIAASELTLSQAATLAGVIKSPSTYAPHINLANALSRRDFVLTQMYECGYITYDEAEKAAHENITVIDAPTAGVSGWYIDAATSEAVDVLGISFDELMTGGYSIYTKFNADIQASVETTISNASFYPDESVQGAMIVMDVDSGAVMAVAGGREYSVRRGLNRALASRRQPGSAIKPVSTYAAAVDRYGYMPTSRLFDVKREYGGGYSPGNASGNFYGDVTMRTALSRSLNAATVDLADAVGIYEVARYARAFNLDIKSDDENLSLALGSMTYGVTPAELCAAYCALSNGGIVNEPFFVVMITDRNGSIIYEHSNEGVRAVSAESAYILTDMLKTTVSSGTASAISGVGLHIAAKTGTSGLENGDTTDAWTVAYTPEIAVAAWIGKDNNADGGMPASVSGGGYPARMCRELFLNIADSLSDSDFSVPSGLTRVVVDAYALDKECRLVLAAPDTPIEYCAYEPVRSGGDVLPISDIWDTPESVNDLAISTESGVPVISFTSKSDYAQYILVKSVGAESEIVAEFVVPRGEEVIYADNNASDRNISYYSVIPRHLLLLEAGVIKLGMRGNIVKYNPGGIMNGIAELFDGGASDDFTLDIDALFR